MNSTKVLVQRANVILEIPDYQTEHYLTQGYNVIDNYGNIIKESVPNNLGTLQQKYVEHTAIIDTLNKQIEELNKQIEELQQKNKKRKTKDIE